LLITTGVTKGVGTERTEGIIDADITEGTASGSILSGTAGMAASGAASVGSSSKWQGMATKGVAFGSTGEELRAVKSSGDRRGRRDLLAELLGEEMLSSNGECSIAVETLAALRFFMIT
jgi:hypothetical protein